ncbi:MAG: YceD family protein [Christensenellales bacterium]
MKIDISETVRNVGEIYTEVYDGPLDGFDFMGEHFSFPDGIHVRADYYYDGKGVVVNGRFSSDVPVLCSRCLKAFVYPVCFEFREYYKEQPKEDDSYPYMADIIDLDRMLQDNVILCLPPKFLCKDDCKGLCGVCGADLNKGGCSCGSEPDESNPFFGLSKLHNNEEV